jgi:hypothetical protein
VTSKLQAKGQSKDFGYMFEARKEASWVDSIERFLADLVGRDLPSALAKFVRVAVPIAIAIGSGVAEKRAERFSTAMVLYGLAAVLFVQLRRSQANVSKAMQALAESTWKEAEALAQAAMRETNHLDRADLEHDDPEFILAMKKLDRANSSMLIALDTPKYPWTMWNQIGRGDPKPNANAEMISAG